MARRSLGNFVGPSSAVGEVGTWRKRSRVRCEVQIDLQMNGMRRWVCQAHCALVRHSNWKFDRRKAGDAAKDEAISWQATWTPVILELDPGSRSVHGPTGLGAGLALLETQHCRDWLCRSPLQLSLAHLLKARRLPCIHLNTMLIRRKAPLETGCLMWHPVWTQEGAFAPISIQTIPSVSIFPRAHCRFNLS
jgi:hypothetical protein